MFIFTACSSLIVQTPFVHFERKLTLFVNYVSQKVFKLHYRLFNEEIWIVPHLQHYNYFTGAGQRLRWCCCMSCQTVTSLRSVYEIGLYRDRRSTSQSDYRPIVIGSRSIGAPLLNNKLKLPVGGGNVLMIKSSSHLFIHLIRSNGWFIQEWSKWFFMNGPLNH